jgi:hypothetical protein
MQQTQLFKLMRSPDMNSAREIIEPYEIALRAAMLSNDVDALDTLLDDDLIFTIPTGQIISKHDDLAAHRSCCAWTRWISWRCGYRQSAR